MNLTRVALTVSVFLNVTLLFFAGVLSQAIVPYRLQMLKDALDWMNFRRNGDLLSSAQLEKNTYYLRWLREEYGAKEHYRGFIVAFQDGVIPKMTLGEGASCNPDYALLFKNPYNLFNWRGITNFTLFSYENRHDTSISYCDFRQGLVCSKVAKKCECATGAAMSPIEPGSPIKRCLLLPGEICALPDLDHQDMETFTEYFIRYMIWNPEKPESCQMGTQCRLIDSAKEVFRCYDTQTHASKWFTSRYKESPIGTPCSLGYYNSRYKSSCQTPWKASLYEQDLSCYDFGPPRDGSFPPGSGKIHREGFCALPAGSFQIRDFEYREEEKPEKYYDLWKGNFIMGFVNRRTVPLNQEELETYYGWYMMSDIYLKIFDTGNSFLSDKVGQRCSVSQTEKFLKIWNYYAGLIEDPPPGSLFVPSATETELNAKILEIRDMMLHSDVDEWKFCKVYWSYSKGQPSPPLRCEPYRPGQDKGRCQKIDDNSTRPFADHVQQLSEYKIKAALAEVWGDETKTIWESESVEKTSEFQGTLGRGVACDYDLDQEMRNLVGGSGAFYTWDQLKQFSYCDRTRLLTCSKTGVCVCYPNTQPRSVTVEGQPYESDYCYAEKGPCNKIDRLKRGAREYYWSKKETEGIVSHYGISEAGQQGCKGGNLCLFVDEDKEECTQKNTQKTGHDLLPAPGPDSTDATGLGSLQPVGEGGKAEAHHLQKCGATSIITLVTIAKLALIN